jgi:ActR/RegA family two-component response regulator/DNA-binding CsgD family transcriptional regulator
MTAHALQLRESQPFQTTPTEEQRPSRVRSMPPVVLVVDDDLRWRRRVARALHKRAIVRTAGTVDAALEVLRDAPISGVVLELVLADGSAWQLLEEICGRRPTLVLSATPSVVDAGRASALGALFASKLEPAGSLQAKLERLAISAARHGDTRTMLVERLCTAVPLTPAERETLRVYLASGQRGNLSAELGIAETSVRSRVRALCRKLGVERLAEVYRLLFEQAAATS